MRWKFKYVSAAVLFHILRRIDGERRIGVDGYHHVTNVSLKEGRSNHGIKTSNIVKC